jgi:hypothetical protein
MQGMVRLPQLKAPSPETLALAGLGGVVLDGLLAAIALFWLIDRSAPPQDLFWQPFSLDHPLGMATDRKLARLAAEPEACKGALAEGGVAFSEAEERSTGFCTTRDAVYVGAGMTRLNPARPVMTCKEALALALFDRQVLQPKAREILGSGVRQIDHYGTYACRRVYGRETGRVSEHAHANAFDLAGVTLDDGRRLTVAAHFRAEDERGEFMRAIRDGACRTFRTVLSPDYNEAHRDHLHLDMGRFNICR